MMVYSLQVMCVDEPFGDSICRCFGRHGHVCHTVFKGGQWACVVITVGGREKGPV